MALLRGLAGGFSRQVISVLFHEQQEKLNLLQEKQFDFLKQ